MGIPTLVVYESRNDVQTKTIAYQTNWDKSNTVLVTKVWPYLLIATD